MQIFYVIFSFVSTFSLLLLAISFRKAFKSLTLMQKLSIILCVVAGIGPMIIGTFEGILGR